MPHVYLVRHGMAMSGANDSARPLNSAGIAEVERVAAWFATAGYAVDEIRHSGKRRAQMTAEILARVLGDITPVEVRGLSPNDDVRPVASELNGLDRSIMLVGHMPFMGDLAGTLLARPPFSFETAGVAVLERNVGGWDLITAVSPDTV